MGFISFIRRLTRKPTRQEPIPLPPGVTWVGVPTRVTYDGFRRAGLAGGPDALVEKQIREWIALTPEERATVPPDRGPPTSSIAATIADREIHLPCVTCLF